MANQDVRVSALQSASTLSTDDLALATVVDELSETGYTSKKITEGAKASQYLEAFTFANLNTSAKTIVGAINEAATTGAGDFPIHIHNSTITETAGEVLDAMADGLKPYVIWTNNAQSNYTFTYSLAAVWNPDATTETLIFGCPITGAVRTIHVHINPTTRTYSSSISIVDYNIPQINDSSTSSSAVWSAQKINSELADKAEIDDDAVSSSTAWSSSLIASLLPTESASGAVASFETPLTLPLVSHNVAIEPVQAGTGDPSPSNVRPISGHSSVSGARTGKNLLNNLDFFPLTQTMTSAYYRELSVTNGLLPSIKLMAGVTYTLSLDVQTNVTPFVLSVGAGNGAYLADITSTSVNSSGRCSLTFTPTQSNLSNGDILAIRTPRYGVARDFTFTIDDVQLEFGSSATTYEPYVAPTTYTRTFLDSNDDPVTVYGGSDNLKTGEGVSDITGIDLGSLTWGKGTYTFYATLPNVRIDSNSLQACSCYKIGTYATTGANLENLSISLQPTGQIFIKDNDKMSGSADDFKQAVSGQILTYTLATPQTFHTDPLNLDTLKGVNNIWADTGETAVEFKQDIQAYIDSRLSSGTRSLSLAKAPVETEETKQEEQEGDENVDR